MIGSISKRPNLEVPMRNALLLAILALVLAAPQAYAQEGSTGQTLYAPVYSHVYHGPRNLPFPLTCTLSVRSTSPTQTLAVEAVDFYNSHGKMVRHFLTEPTLLPPMSTLEYIVHEKDNDGGSGANFVVRWSATAPVNPPLVEAVMIGTSSNQGISFTSRAVEIRP